VIHGRRVTHGPWIDFGGANLLPVNRLAVAGGERDRMP
jgi:hypothetical protein